uniref:Uncharacterized protein n=1 Tax=Cyanistes caeruleus TaxID=156563 RepID=A0A8C0UX93_CYACU
FLSADAQSLFGGGGSLPRGITLVLQVKQIEKRDSVLTSKNQIDRLTRPGSSYFNLNPFEVSLNILHSFLNWCMSFLIPEYLFQ